VRLLQNSENRGFAAAVNRGSAEARAPLVLLLNSDAELRPGALRALVTALSTREDLALVGPRVVGEGGAELSFGPEPTLLSEWRQRRLVRGSQGRDGAVTAEVEVLTSRPCEPGWISAACCLVRKAALEKVGGFDEGFFLYEEDVDLCLRLHRAGFGLLFLPDAQVLHHRGRSMEILPARSRLEYDRSHIRLYRKHQGRASTLALRLLLVLRGGFGVLFGKTKDDRSRSRERLRLALRGT
jgi:GT2 family glycosyltransferase